MQRLRMRLAAFVVAMLTVVPALATTDDDPLARSVALVVAGKRFDAEAQLQQVASTAHRTFDRRQEATARMLLGALEHDLRRPDVARAELRQAVALFASADDWFAVALTCTAAAELERGDAQTEEALKRNEEALEAIRAAAAVPLSLDILKAFAPASPIRLDAFGELTKMSELMKPLLLQMAEAAQRDRYASALLDADRVPEAEAQLARAESLSTLFPGMGDASIAAHLGDIDRRRGCLDQARQRYEDALEKLHRGAIFGVSDTTLELHILGDLSDVERLRGDTDAALVWNGRARTIVSGSPQEASVLGDRADLLMDDDRFDDAERAFDEGMTIAHRGGDLDRQATLFSGRGAMNFFRGHYGAAASDLERAVDLYDCLGESYVEAPVWGTLAEVYTLLGSNENARQATERGKALAKASNFPGAAALMDVISAMNDSGEGARREEIASSLTVFLRTPGLDLPAGVADVMRSAVAQQYSTAGAGAPSLRIPVVPALAVAMRGVALMRQGDFAAARAVFAQALRTVPGGDLRAGLLALIGACDWREGKEAEATQAFTDAAASLELTVDDVRVDDLVGSYLGGSRHVYFDLVVELLLRQGKVVEAFDMAERARARAFLQMIGNTRLDARRGANAAMVHEAETLRAHIARIERGGGDSAGLRQARSRYEALLTRMKASNPEYASLTAVAPLGVSDVRAALRQGTTLISYFVTAHGVHAWVVDDATFRHVTLPVHGAELERIACWADSLGGRGSFGRGVKPVPIGCPGGTATADEAFERLFAPIESVVPNRRLVIVPHGVLHYVPFAALRDAKTGRYLVEDYTITYAPSGSAIRFLRGKESPMKKQALVLGDPAGAPPRLEGAEREAIAVGRALGATPLLGAAATRSAVLQHAGVGVIHIAAHGEYDAANPLFSHIALAGGDLDVHDILSSVDLTGVELVVLSACESGRGARGRGDDIVGLTRALLYAGTPGVIATLWNIDDNGAARLMSAFYDRFRAGETAADALRDAQLASLRGGFADPKDWAAFTMTGDPEGRWLP